MTDAPPSLPSARPGTLSDRMVDLVARGLIGTAMALPYEQRVPFFGSVARRLAGPLAGYRRRALRNLLMIRPTWPEEERHRVAEGVLDNFGRSIIETYSWREFGPRMAGVPLSGGGLPHLLEARAQGRPVIFVTGHFGNYEAARQAIVHRGFQVGGFYREMNNPFVNRHYVSALTGPGNGPAFAKGKRGMLGFLRHIAGGGMAVILFDLHDQAGVPIPFLGRPAMTATTAADLALRYDALLMP